jgi:hypothetical protein
MLPPFPAVDLRADLDLPVLDRAREVHAHDLEVELADARPPEAAVAVNGAGPILPGGRPSGLPADSVT